jgi:hypothetical protein
MIVRAAGWRIWATRPLMVLFGTVAVLGGLLVQQGTHSSSPPRPSAADALPQSSATSAPTPDTPFEMPRSAPVRLLIPRLMLDAPITGEPLDSTGAITVPDDTNRHLVGWYQDGAAPGSTGTAVLLGHVDTMAGPAVFYGLCVLHKGDTVAVVRADHSTATFTVDGVDVYLKSQFPDQVYEPAARPELRLITCGGAYVKSSGGYQGNVVVYAHLLNPPTAGPTPTTGQAPTSGANTPAGANPAVGGTSTAGGILTTGGKLTAGGMLSTRVMLTAEGILTAGRVPAAGPAPIAGGSPTG